MTRTKRRMRCFALPAALFLGVGLGPGLCRPCSAAPPWLERIRAYRIVDASGRITPRVPTDGQGRVALRPAVPPSLLLRGRPLYLSGYAGARYAPAGAAGPYAPTSFGAPGHHHGAHARP